MKVTQKTQAWGNSTGLRLPKKVLQKAGWKDSQIVTIKVDGDIIILSPQKTGKSKQYDLDELVSGITPDNVHKEIDWGGPVGKEIW